MSCQHRYALIDDSAVKCTACHRYLGVIVRPDRNGIVTATEVMQAREEMFVADARQGIVMDFVRWVLDKERWVVFMLGRDRFLDILSGSAKLGTTGNTNECQLWRSRWRAYCDEKQIAA